LVKAFTVLYFGRFLGIKNRLFSLFSQSCSEHFQLLGGWGSRGQAVTIKYFHHTELLVGNAHDTYMTFRWQYLFYPFYMRLRIFPAATVPHINAELEHLETIFQDVLAEPGIYFSLRLGFRGKVKKY
jgi:hypothetical protein